VIGLDTNILLRLLLKDDEQQLLTVMAALDSISEDEPAVVNVIVIQEAVWVMTKTLAFPKQKVIKILKDLLDQDDLMIVSSAAVRKATAAWAGGKAEFADYLIAELNAEGGCRTTLTFDALAAQHPAFTPVIRRTPVR
jgi:predicted nucleic-acid-binding protein